MKKTKRICFALLSTSILLMNILTSTNVNANTNEGKTSGNTEVKVGLTAGELILKTSDAVGFGTHTIESKKKVVKSGFADNFGVIDSRGTQEGWQVTVSATPFEIVEPINGFVIENGVQTNGYSLPVGSLYLSSLIKVENVNSELKNYDPLIHPVDTAIDMNQAIKVVTADVGKGMGEYVLTFGDDALSLVIDPVTAKIDTVNYPDTVTPYSSTLTWNLVSGPEKDFEWDDYEEDIEENDIGDFDYRIIDEQVSIINYKGTSKKVKIPRLIEGYPVVFIEDSAFKNKGLTAINLPDTIITIGDNAFRDNSIKQLYIPDSLIKIGKNAFRENKMIYIGFRIYNNLSYIDDFAFANNELYMFSPPYSLTHVGNQSFASNKITSVSTSGLEYIGERAFAFNLLDQVTIESNLKSLGEGAFKENHLEITVLNYNSLDVKDYFESGATIVDLRWK